MVQNNKQITVGLSIPTEINNKEKEGELKSFSAVAYAGNSVDLTDYGVDAPVVYNVKGARFKNKIPYLYDHWDPIGHAENIQVATDKISMNLVHSFPGERSDMISKAISNGVPFQSSMGITISPNDKVSYIEEGKVVVNNKEHEAPVYVVESFELIEQTATLFGRDSETVITQMDEGILMKIKNSKNVSPPKDDVQNSTPTPEETNNPPKDVVKNSLPTPEPNNPPKDVVDNGPPPKSDGLRVAKLMVQHKGHEELVLDGLEKDWSDEQIENSIKLHKLENNYQPLPGSPSGADPVANQYLARLALGVGINPETISNHLGESVTDSALKQGGYGLKEALTVCANMEGGRFTGHSDVRNMTKFLKKLTINNAYSTVDFPNLMHQIAEWKLEEYWAIDEPWAPSRLKVLSNSDFRKTGHIKAKGGQMWNGLNQEGKIEHASFGQEDTYETQLNTVAQIITFKREDIENDSIGWIDEVLGMMVEGALMVPDYQLVNLIYNARPTGANVLVDHQSYFNLPLNETNLSTVYQRVRRRSVVKGDRSVNARFNTRWRLVVSPDMEETAWNILKQDRIVADGNKTVVGERNYWFNRLDLDTFDQLDNETYHPDAASNVWGLMPSRDMLAPFAISYLRGQRRPTTEVVDLPADELGFGVRGWWDVNVDYRPLENNKLQATAWSFPDDEISSET